MDQPPPGVVARAHVSDRRLLPSVAALCDAFYHVKDTPEAQIGAQCLRVDGGCCSGKTTCLIARLLSADGEEQFVQLYRNESQTSCAEGFLIRDARLMSTVASVSGCTLHIYLTQQPCHYSSSNDDNSCTENLLRWWREVLQPNGVTRVRIAATYPYRTHWDERHMSENDLAALGRRKWGRGRGRGRGGGRDSPAERRSAIERARRLLASARDGTRLLTAPGTSGLTLEAFSEDDWAFVLSVCDEAVAARYAACEAPFTREAKMRRAALDAFTKRTFDAFRPPSEPALARSSPPPPAGSDASSMCADCISEDGAVAGASRLPASSSDAPPPPTPPLHPHDAAVAVT
jgi:hypothetical protein